VEKVGKERKLFSLKSLAEGSFDDQKMVSLTLGNEIA
jgi:hypothetical protein